MKPRWAVLVLGAVLLWTVAVLFWASQPLTDNVPTGTKDAPHSVAVNCPAPWSTDSAPTDDPLPDLTGSTREPCTQIHRQAQLLLVFDLVVSAVAIGLLGWVLVRRSPADEPAIVAADAPPAAATPGPDPTA